MGCVLPLRATSVRDGACPTLDDAARLIPTEVPASPPPRFAAISSAVSTHRRDRLKPWPAFGWNKPARNPWVGVNASTTAWLPTPTTSCARQSYLGCAQQHSAEQREQLFIVDVSGYQNPPNPRKAAKHHNTPQKVLAFAKLTHPARKSTETPLPPSEPNKKPPKSITPDQNPRKNAKKTKIP